MPNIRPATPADLNYALDLQRRFSNQVGFVRATAYSDRIRRGHLLMRTDNDQPTGMLLYWPRRDRVLTISQAAVELDLQRDTRGARLVYYLTQQMRFSGHCVIRLAVRDDLTALAFWRACGFRVTHATRTPTARGRTLIHMAAYRDSVSIATRALTELTHPRKIPVPVGG